MLVSEKISALRKLMKDKKLDAYIIPSTDPHISEYVADVWFSRAWISGFDGSAGTVVVTADNAGLWTDSRYFLQGSQQLEGTGIDLHKMGEAGVLDFPEWLLETLHAGAVVGFDGKCFQAATTQKLKSLFGKKNISINSDYDLLDLVWNDRPSIPMNSIFLHNNLYAGKTCREKIQDIQKELVKKGADAHLICTLDDIAWIFNIRGNDVSYNPVAISYALITQNSANLYVFEDKVPAEVRTELSTEGIILKDYHDIGFEISKLEDGTSILIDSARSNTWLWNLVPAGVRIIDSMNISTMMKACKNSTELKGMYSAMRRDGAAFTEFIYWLENTIGKEKITEISTADKLRDFRKKKDLFFGESFNSIIGYAGHGAIVHYGASEETNVEIGTDTFLLTDSGGQYYDGTTDITRMFHFGTPTDEEKRDYTLVLKGHIYLTMAKFPYGTRGAQLDALARKHLWDHYMTYGHGTGHGVGCFLNVHEGPQNIRKEENPTILEPGMILSNEPGVYKNDKYGIRIENLIVVADDLENEFGRFLKFENLTLAPIDTKAIDKSLLCRKEIEWLNDYHKIVFEQVSPLLNNELKEFLKEKCKPI